MADALRPTTPIDAAGGFAGRRHGQQPEPQPRRDRDNQRAPDRVSRESRPIVARQLLRERVLSRTRVLLEAGDGANSPAFAEVLDGESVGAFVGRLLSAQNQLVAHRTPAIDARLLRRCLDAALHEGVAEARELLRDDAAGLAFVADVMAEYGRRVAAVDVQPAPGSTFTARP